MATIKVTDATIKTTIQNNRLVLVDFWAPWCGPCRMIGPILEQLSEEMEGKAVIAKLNVDENPVGAIDYQIQGIPTLKLFKDGREMETIVGVQPKSRLKDLLNYYSN